MKRAKREPSKRETPIFERVRGLIRKIPRGKVATYGLLSQLVDGRLTPVGIGWALSGAPEGSCPWHRVVNSKGGMSTDTAHPGLQRRMLESEGVRFLPDGRIDLDKYLWRKKPRPRADRP
jgi:methylated-DNA-protein-cysteine methyltransferase-like protein